MATYISLVNRLLRRINETEIEEEDFDNVRGLQATVKDAILDTVNQIYNSKNNWVFNAVEHTQTLTIGQEEYPWPTRFIMADWNSFQLQKDDVNLYQTEALKYINRDKWYVNRMRDTDYDAGITGVKRPCYVFQAHGQGWGVTPSPDKEYQIKFRYFKSPDDLVNATDVCAIPDRFTYVIMSGGLCHMNFFKDNAELAVLTDQKYANQLSHMIKQEISWPLELEDTRVPQ